MSARKVPLGVADKLTNSVSRVAGAIQDIRVADIAAASGIPRTTLYYYFSGRDELLSIVLRSMLDDLRVSVAAAIDVPGDARTLLDAVVRAQLAHLAANPAVVQLLLMSLGRPERLGSIASDLNAAFRDPVRQIVADGVAAGDLADTDPDLAASAICGAVVMVGLHGLAVGDIDLRATADRIVVVFWRGIGARGAQASKVTRPSCSTGLA